MKLPEGWLKNQRHPDLRAAEQLVIDAAVNLEKTAQSARSTCVHAVVAEAPFFNSKWLATLPPFRVCVQCGFREQGWGCGYHALGNDPERMVIDLPREEAYALATEPERVSGWWIVPVGKTELRDPYQGYPDD